VLELLREAEALAERRNDDARRGRVCAFMTNIHTRLGDPDEALVSGGRALEIAARLGDLRLRILATTYLVQAHFHRGEYARVVELATANLAARPRLGPRVLFAVNRPRSTIASGSRRPRPPRPFAGHPGCAEAIRLAEPTPRGLVGLAYHAAGTLSLVKGDWATALADRAPALVLGRGNRQRASSGHTRASPGVSVTRAWR
jgi:hypothetical protein